VVVETCGFLSRFRIKRHAPALSEALAVFEVISEIRSFAEQLLPWKPEWVAGTEVAASQ